MKTLTKEQIANEYPPTVVESWCPRGHVWLQGVGWVGKRYDQRPHSNAVIASWDRLTADQMEGWFDDETIGKNNGIIYGNGAGELV